MEDNKNNYRYLGYVNGWSNTPEEVAKCEKQNHQLTIEIVFNCVKKYSCPICKYYYLVDSTD